MTSVVKLATVHGSGLNPFYESLCIGRSKTGIIQ
nr:MAG TPA: hypothetical protein [Caudoviricetes sp.]